MKSFKQHLSEQKNTHMTHIEDKVIFGGVDGTRQAIFALRSLRDMLAGKHQGKVSVKWDGAPAIFCGTDPSDGKFFVAKKGIFNKNPKVYKSDADIDADTQGDLAVKLKAALKYLPSLGIKGVIQGDFLFGPGDLKKKKIDGQEYVIFHPNTIVYAVPVDQAKEVLSAKIGIVWHTSYKGDSFETMKADYGVDVKSLKTNSNVWSQDAMLTDLSKATMSKRDTDEVNKLLSQAGKLFNQISGSTLRQLESHPELPKLIDIFNNRLVRNQTVMKDPRKHVDQLIKFIEDRYAAEIDKLKTERGKSGKRDKRDAVLAFFSNENKQSLVKMFELQRTIVLAKIKLINKLNELKSIGTFVKTSKGYKVTGEEGYVAIDTLGGDAVKLVDRMEFSYNNFSPDILKGWDSASRN